jgi:hypothetical protein
MQCLWKENWEETKVNFRKWWKQDGLLVNAGHWPCPEKSVPHDQIIKPPEKENIEECFTDVEWRAASNHYQLSNSEFFLDSLPVTNANYGPGNLANFIGSESGFSEETVWFYPTMQDKLDPEKLPPLTFDPENRWWKIVESTLKLNAEMGRGKYLTGCPDLVENIDVLASLRDPQVLLMDMIERPEWIEEKMMEINQVWFEAYDKIYDIIKGDDGSSAFWAFSLWGEGKTAKVQCDASAMFSPDMFKRFVVPALTEQCEWLDYSMFHLDGHQCICHLDHLLAIDALDAIEWTPDPTVPGGGSSEWYEMYKRILGAGKSLQAIGLQHDEIKPLLDAIGPEGVYIFTSIKSEADAEKVANIIEEYR